MSEIIAKHIALIRSQTDSIKVVITPCEWHH